MFNLYDIAYWIGLVASSPYWLIKPAAREQVRRAFRERMGDVAPRASMTPAIWIHAVSLGEINATRALIDELRRARPDLAFIVSTTTRTGYERGGQLYGNAPHVQLIRYPLDFSSAINRALDALRPNVVVLMELEVWPNFVLQCARRDIPVMLANGRITETSYRKYMWIKPVTARMMRRLSRVCAQDETYAARFVAMGARPRDVQVAGTMKFDTAPFADRVEGDTELASQVGLHPGKELIWVCGSTGPGEEGIVLKIFRSIIHDMRAEAGTPIGVPASAGMSAIVAMRLAIIPRHPERFDDVGNLIRQHGFNVVRRSQPSQSIESHDAPAVILGDTMGELRKFYSLADIVFVGRSLVDLGPRQHGSDMIEPAALGKPVIVGPYTANFAEAIRKFKQAEAVMEVSDRTELRQALAVLHSTPEEANAMAQRAREVVRREQGATARHTSIILE